MTAPDSVERVVAEMRIPHEGGWDNDDVDALADRLQALARGPQQAGGEDGEVLPKAWWVDRLKQQEALTDAAIARAETAEAALREAGRDAVAQVRLCNRYLNPQQYRELIIDNNRFIARLVRDGDSGEGNNNGESNV